MSLEEKLNTIQTIKENIKNKIIDKGVDVASTVPFANYPNYINMIGNQEITIDEEEWTPDPSWWDIDSIINDPNYDYYGNGENLGIIPSENATPYNKIIVLLDDTLDYTVFQIGINQGTTTTDNAMIHAVYTSDGQLHIASSTSQQNITHTWDKTKDKPTSTGEYKTRFAILYTVPLEGVGVESRKIFGQTTLSSYLLYLITEVQIKYYTNHSCPKLLAFKGIKNGCWFLNNSESFLNSKNLKYYSIEKVYGNNICYGALKSCYLKYFKLKQTGYIAVDETTNLKSYNIKYYGDSKTTFPIFDVTDVDFSDSQSGIFDIGIIPLKVKGVINLENNVLNNSFSLFYLGDNDFWKYYETDFSLNLPPNADVSINCYKVSEASLQYLVENAPTITEAHTLKLREPAFLALKALSPKYFATYNGEKYSDGYQVLTQKGWTVQQF